MKWVIKGIIATVAAIVVYVFLSLVIGIIFSNMILTQTIAVIGAILVFLAVLFGKGGKGGGGNDGSGGLDHAQHQAHMMDIRNS
ncbi:MAG: hypothetical protein CMK09_04245 [Ponticaulis sp.]|nr:hypothetical protein [Ponticaulis sp.]|tara:strand:- start:5421 stop:5672 length:252 start_codon:yes stop_codon:yes gene_type:complete